MSCLTLDRLEPRMIRFRLVIVPLIVFVVIGPGDALAGDTMTFKNNLLPGHLTVHRITRTTRRKAPRRDFVEKLTYRQTADWVRCNLAESKPGSVTVYQMMTDRAAKVRGLRHGKKKIKPLPPPDHFNLSGGSTRLHSANLTPRDAPYQVPLCDAAERAALRSLFDFAHWPRGKIDASHRWERDVDGGGFKGTQTLEFVDLVRFDHDTIGKGEIAARLTLYVQGAFTGALEKNYTFVKGQAVIHWARLDRTLLRMEARAEYKRRRPNGDEDYELRVEIDLKRMKMLNEAERDGMIDQLNVFAEALKRRQQGEPRETLRLCRQFHEKWPRSIWGPAIEELEERLTRAPRAAAGLKTSELKELLSKSLLAWEAGRSTYQYDLMDRTRKGLRQLCRDYRDKIRRLAKAKQSRDRAPAVFALAFSDDPDDFYLVQKSARDKSARVRSMALAGITARGSPQTSVDLLLLLLSDKKASVRSRACQAVAACVPREHFSIDKAAEKIAGLMIDDEKAAVRLAAIRALAAIGAPTDIAKLEKALHHELDKTNRREIDKAIKVLEALNG